MDKTLWIVLGVFAGLIALILILKAVRAKQDALYGDEEEEVAVSANAPAITTNTGSEPRFNQRQPCVVTSAPEANEVNAMAANTQKLMAACARSFSSGR